MLPAMFLKLNLGNKIISGVVLLGSSAEHSALAYLGRMPTSCASNFSGIEHNSLEPSQSDPSVSHCNLVARTARRRPCRSSAPTSGSYRTRVCARFVSRPEAATLRRRWLRLGLSCGYNQRERWLASAADRAAEFFVSAH